MKSLRFRLNRSVFVPILVVAFASPGPFAQQPPATTPAPAAPAAKKTFSQQDLDQLLAPIALYPDALVAQVLMAATYPLEVVEAARWSKANPTLKGKALEEAMQKQTWDPAVKALTAVPQVLRQMDEKLDWTQKLGDAFLAQQADVMKTVQGLRAKAQAAGNLKSTNEQKVKTEQQGGQTVYIIESAKPEVVYVPTYNPYTIYGTWWYAYPPYYMYPPAYVYPPGVAFAAGVVVGAAIWGNCNWGGNSVNINVNQYNSYNKTNISNTNYQHNVNSRKGVAYQDSGVAQQYSKGSSAQATQAREQYRGKSEQGVTQAQGANRSQVQGQAKAAGSAGAGSSAAASSASSRAGSSGLSGAGTGGGAATREASARGGASRGGGGGRHR